jgi:3-isopropylmalate dehydrogenase
MAKYRIAWLPGDGIGREVSAATRLVLEAAGLDAEFRHGAIGWDCWRKEGEALPSRTLDLLAHTDCAFFGAITSKPAVEAERDLAPELQGQGFEYRSPIIRMRQLLDLYICRRPCRSFSGNPLNYRHPIDLVVFRENTEGMYIGVEFPKVPEAFRSEAGFQRIPADAAVSIRSVTPEASRRIVEAAFRYALEHGRRKVTAVHKANVLRATCGVFLEAARGVASRYPGIAFETANVDAMCMWLVKNPEAYDVIVTTNLFGDILSDLCAQLVGGMGFAYSGNIGDKYAVFEPTHGSAPKYAGLHKVNPLAAIMAGGMMAEWLGEARIGQMIQGAVGEVIARGACRTYDMGGHATTMEMAHAVATALHAPHWATEDLVNMRATVPQRIDTHGSKVEEMAGTGAIDSKGG